ncbi:uncharacterized protein A4U43_C02F6520 [Asparagus officinalis]|uniref:Protein kinase domain-containing protein n=1 Tax=Asparagus officinalis TaxID=4686 RepID=A0A5P1FJ64_ASPOF|nr:leucine-rich repeat receptor-like tyrosine-protein kinase PXC3 isoform X2 [Asparagus officinalis]ONK77437.1 uncharacterized protein A4U43_C02F6520 [Asparagus officinalis]
MKSGLSRLKTLDLSDNSIEGPIPLFVGVEVLLLSGNKFSGEIPNSISQLKNLTALDLSMNNLSGSVPDEIGELSKLETLILSSNNLTGKIPSNLSSIRSLRRFAANQNGFTGLIPDGLTRHLNFLDLSYNSLGGRIPLDFLSSPTLEYVDLSWNHLEGAIPRDISQSLFRLRLGGNKLTGKVPSLFQQRSNLTYLELDTNQLDGEIPSELEICQKLTLLNLASNQLNGSLPKALANLSQLVIMKLQENSLSGEIPTEFSKLGNLITLNLSHNSLSGEIPSSISSLSKLSNLNLAVNKLSGPIPSNINELSYLIELQLGNNDLIGTVPRMPNSLTTALNLSNNQLSGPIPSHLGSLGQLEILDLSNNNFTGEVPVSLTQMQSLTLLVISNNDLSGTLPKFPHFVNVTYSGNNGLVKPEAVPTSPEKKKPNTVLIIIVSIVSAIIGVGLLAAFCFLVIAKRLYRVEDVGLQLEESPPQIINSCYITSDSIHKSNIDFSRAMEVVSNPSNLTLKTRFSTYYKAIMPSGMSYCVKKLNSGEKIFQMGGNERFGQELQVLGRLSNSNVMVPLAYVLTRDSAYLFYEDVHKGTAFDFLHKDSGSALDWQSRYSIALGVAQGLTFLHGCTQPVLLWDLSSKTIHLKSMREPQIGDIELSKVIDPSRSTGSLSTVAGSVGYIPPEYAYTMRVTAAGNVYSFGVILLELLTGKPPVSQGTELAKWALSFSTRVSHSEQILDSRVSSTSPAVHSQMLSVLKIALSCVSLSPESRPKMRNVLRSLFNAR